MVCGYPVKHSMVSIKCCIIFCKDRRDITLQTSVPEKYLKKVAIFVTEDYVENLLTV